MKKNMSLFLKGIILGISFVLPGISGGVLAISMGIYEKLISSISNLFKDIKENLKFLIPIGLGALVSVILFVLFLDYIFEKFPVPSTLLFLGLILGGLPSLYNNLKNKFNLKNVLYFLIGFLLIFILDSLVENDSNLLNAELTIINILKLATIGIVMAGSIIVPGISGSILLMSMGYYKTFLEITSQIIKLQNLSTNILLVLPIGIGGIIGLIFFIKLIEFCLKSHRDKTNFLIFGIVMSSVIKVIILVFDYNITLVNIIVGILLLITGILISTKFFKE